MAGCICLSAPPVVWQANQPETHHGTHDKFPHKCYCLGISSGVNLLEKYFTRQNLVPLHFKGVADNTVPPILAEILPCCCIYKSLMTISMKKKLYSEPFTVHCVNCTMHQVMTLA